MKPLRTFSIALLGVLALIAGSCQPHHELDVSNTTTFSYATQQAYEAAYQEAIAVPEREYGDWAHSPGTYTAAYIALRERLWEAETQEEFLALVQANPDLVYIDGDRIAAVVDFTSVGRLADTHGMYTVGDYAYRQVKDYTLRVPKAQQHTLLNAVVEQGELLALPAEAEIVEAPAHTLGIEFENPECASNIREVETTMEHNKWRLTVKLKSTASSINEDGARRHYIEIKIKPEERILGFYFNHNTNIYTRNHRGIIQSCYAWDEVNDVFPPHIVTFEEEGEGEEEIVKHLNSGGYTRQFKIKWFSDPTERFYSLDNPDKILEWVERRFEAYVEEWDDGISIQFLNLNCDAP